MYQKELIQKLKQTNVSVDGEKTKERVEKLWKSANSELKHLVEQDTGSVRATIYRVYNTGAISAKLAVAFAQRLNSNPYYLTGEVDEDSGYSKETVDRFLRDKGYAKLLDNLIPESRPKRKYQKRNKTSDSNQVITSNEVSGVENTNVDAIFLDTEGENVVSDEAATGTDITPLYIESETKIVSTSDADSKSALEDITEDDMVTILHALVIRARVNKGAREQLMKIKHLLVY